METKDISNQVRGLGMDAQTRCLHYHSSLDIIAIKMRCCNTYYACKDCHEALAGHPINVWPVALWDHKAVLCGNCAEELTIAQYMATEYSCPACGADFNPGCRNHYDFYFSGSTGKSKPGK